MEEAAAWVTTAVQNGASASAGWSLCAENFFFLLVQAHLLQPADAPSRREVQSRIGAEATISERDVLSPAHRTSAVVAYLRNGQGNDTEAPRNDGSDSGTLGDTLGSEKAGGGPWREWKDAAQRLPHCRSLRHLRDAGVRRPYHVEEEADAVG